MNIITINGKTYSGKNSVVVENGRVIIDGKDATPDEKVIHISVQGNISNLEVAACEEVTVTGDVGSIKTVSGDVEVAGNVTGSIKTMSGDVRCGDVQGNVTTMSGNIKQRKD